MTSACTLAAQTVRLRDARLMSALLRRVEQVNDVSTVGQLTPFLVDGNIAGELQPAVVDALREFPQVVQVDRQVTLAPCLASAGLEERSSAFSIVASYLRSRGMVKSWRDELISVTTRIDAAPVLLVERGCIPLLGAKGYGAAVVGFTTCPASGEQMVWVAQRSLTKPTWPGMLDVMAAGAVSAGQTPAETARNEASEEAGLPAALAAHVRPAGAVSYRGVDEWGQLKRDVFFTFDLELPWSFEPSPHDGVPICPEPHIRRLLSMMKSYHAHRRGRPFRAHEHPRLDSGSCAWPSHA